MSLVDWLIGVNSTFNTSRLYHAMAVGLGGETDCNIKIKQKEKLHTLSLFNQGFGELIYTPRLGKEYSGSTDN